MERSHGSRGRAGTGLRKWGVRAAMPPGAGPRRPRVEKLWALFFEDDFRFLGRSLLLAVGTGHVPERRGLRIRGAELPQRNFSLSIGVSAAANEGRFRGHGMQICMLRMADGFDYLWLVGEHRNADLSEGGAGAENEQR